MPAGRPVLFDLDGTICTHNRAVDDVLLDAFELAGVEPFFDGADWAEVIPEIASADSQSAFRRQCFSILAQRQGRERDHAMAVADAYADVYDPENVRLLPGARAALRAVGRHHRLGLVTNAGPEVQMPKLQALSLTDTFETVVFAGTETAAKPDPAAFDAALEHLNASPADAVHVGNSLAADVAGAKAAGLAAVWVSSALPGDLAGRPQPDHTIRTLQDLPRTLGVAP